MLVLTLKKNEVVLIGDDIEVQVVEIKKGIVKLGIRAPKQIAVDRAEVRKAKREGLPNAVLAQDAPVAPAKGQAD